MNVTRYKCSVLVVDDDPAVRAVLADQLAPDFEVATAGSVGEARGVMAGRSVDVLLTDLQLPDGSGLQLLDWARRTCPRTARVLLTGTARLEDAADAINHTQIHRLVLKPWRAEDLLQTLRAAGRSILLERSHEQLLDELRQLNQELERRVADRTRELEGVLAQVQQKTRILEQMALTDPLTQVPNRRAVDLIARKELLRRTRTPAPLAVGLVDADHFKRVNTDHLQTGGDFVLSWLARVLAEGVRATDSIGRVGGEEFMVVAPDTDPVGAAALGERLRSRVAAAPCDYHGRPVPVTISIGFAVAPAGTPAGFEQIREAAAAALKEAKDGGRDRCVVRSVH
ncbi:MAG: diguanylate cyclase [Gemmataceae bacterium]|nr:diguanylate cyclase [Gemmataceae bacterium]